MGAALYAGSHLLGTLELDPIDDGTFWVRYEFSPHANFAAYKDLFNPPKNDSQFVQLVCFWTWGKKRRQWEDYYARLDALDLRVVEDGQPDLCFHWVSIHNDLMACRPGAIRRGPQSTT